MHSRNKHIDSYPFSELTDVFPKLSKFVKLNNYGIKSIDFSNPDAVKALNTALLKTNYNIEYWDFPKGYLCPPIPGRVDYIHYLADLLADDNLGSIPKGKKIKCLDIGTGANCIYPILGVSEYGWRFVGTDIDKSSLESAQNIVNANSSLKNNVEIRWQENPKTIFKNIIQKKEFFDLTICNPPFHKSETEAMQGTRRKNFNLGISNKHLNFEGQSNELWCKGGEKMFIKNMIKESKQFSKSCRWFTTLVSKKENLNSFYDALKKVNAEDVRTIEMTQGHKKSRILAWSYFKKNH